MKLRNELNFVTTEYKKNIDKIEEYAKWLKENGEYKNFETRLSWDILRGIIGTTTICSWYDKYDCNDAHIKTLARRALKEVYTI